MDVGAIFWLAVFALAACALLCRLGELVLDCAVAIAAALRARGRREGTLATPHTESDPFPWVDAQSVRFDGEHGDDRDELEPPMAPWEPPPPADAPCPSCRGQMLPVLYGYSAGDVIAAAEQGLIILGGCMPGGPRYRCPSCDDGWRAASPAADEPRARSVGPSVPDWRVRPVGAGSHDAGAGGAPLVRTQSAEGSQCSERHQAADAVAPAQPDGRCL